jgi:hypothetical protein
MEKASRKFVISKTAWLLLGVLVIGPIVCSLTFDHMWWHGSLVSGSCLIASLITGGLMVSSQSLVFSLGLVALLIGILLSSVNRWFNQSRARWPANFFWLYSSWLLPRNYVLQALMRGILQAKIY